MKTIINKTLSLLVVLLILSSTTYSQQKTLTAAEIIALIRKETRVP